MNSRVGPVLKLTAIMILMSGCQTASELEKFKSLCKNTGGEFADCRAAFAQQCAQAPVIDGVSVICSCREGKAWNDVRGCVNY